MVRQYVILVGVGRSGTNWASDLLDLSAQTHCRNASVVALPSSRLAPLIGGLEPLGDDPDFGHQWDAGVAEFSMRMGAMDRRIAAPKLHLHRWAHTLGLTRAVNRPRVRALLSVVQPSLRGDDWEVPWWIGSKRRLSEAIPVLRTNAAISCLDWVLTNRPQARVVHMARHPGGYLNSWQRRFVAVHDLDQIQRDNVARLETVVRIDESWRTRFGDISAMSPQESEIWFWRFATEAVWKAGRNQPRYKLVTFESLAFDQEETLRSIYEHCGLDWSPAVAAAAAGMRSQTWGQAVVSAPKIADAWRAKLKPEDVDMVDRILEDSSVRHLWE